MRYIYIYIKFSSMAAGRMM